MGGPPQPRWMGPPHPPLWYLWVAWVGQGLGLTLPSQRAPAWISIKSPIPSQFQVLVDLKEFEIILSRVRRKD